MLGGRGDLPRRRVRPRGATAKLLPAAGYDDRQYRSCRDGSDEAGAPSADFRYLLGRLDRDRDVRRIVAFLMIHDVIVRRLASSLQGMATGTVPMNPAAVAMGSFVSAQFDKPYGLSIMVAALPPVRSVACIGPIHYRVTIQRNRRGCWWSACVLVRRPQPMRSSSGRLIDGNSIVLQSVGRETTCRLSGGLTHRPVGAGLDRPTSSRIRWICTMLM